MLYRGALRDRDGDRVTLAPTPGAWRRTIDRRGDVLSETYVPGATPWANIGDELLLCGPALDEIATAVVVAVIDDGRALRLRIAHGRLDVGSTRAQVMRLRIGARR